MAENFEAPQVQETTPQEPVVESQTQDVETTQEVVETPQDESQAQEQSQEVVDDGKPKPIIEGLTYTSQEELVKGVKSKDEYIEKLRAEIEQSKQSSQDVYQQLGFQNEMQFKNAQVEQQLATQYNNEVAMVENAYNTDLITLNNALDNGQLSEFDYQNKVAELQQLRVDYFASAKANNITRRQQFQQQSVQAQQQAFEQEKSSLYEAHKEHKELIDLFYDPQPTIEKAIALKQAIGQQAVEAYKASLELAKQNESDIAKLPKSNGQSVEGQPKTDYSTDELAELAKTNPEAFAKWCKS